MVLEGNNGWTYVLCFGLGAIVVALVFIAVSISARPVALTSPNYVSLPPNYVIKERTY